MRVLVCEDSPGDFLLLSRQLRAIGVEKRDIECARTINEARVALARRSHNVAFVDYRLADGTGLDVLREAIALDWAGPIIMLTSYADPSIDNDALLLGACDFLHKSEVRPETIERAIRYSTERKRLEALAAETNSELLGHIRALAQAKAEIESMNKRVLSLADHLAAPNGGALADGGEAAHSKAELGIWRFDHSGRSIHANEAVLRVFELDTEEELRVRDLEAILSAESCARLKRALPTIRASAAVTIEVEAVNQVSGQHRWVVMSLVASDAVDEQMTFVATVVDVTNRRNIENVNRYLARHDTLTGLANRAAFNERLSHDTAVARRNGSYVALICIDLDRFKAVNDSHGHLVGDALLKAVAERLTECARESDTVARLGGDEFAVIATNIQDETGVDRLVKKILELFEAPFVLNGKRILCGASVGYSIFPTQTDDLETLFEQSDAALYRNKRREIAELAN